MCNKEKEKVKVKRKKFGKLTIFFQDA